MVLGTPAMVGFVVALVAAGTYELRDPDRFDWWLYNDAHESEAAERAARSDGRLRGLAFVLGGLAVIALEL